MSIYFPFNNDNKIPKIVKTTGIFSVAFNATEITRVSNPE